MQPKKKLYVTLYFSTLILSAFLLFVVQPMFGKMLLPLLGGAQSVWNTALFFFQMMLLAGYIYAHLLAKFMNIRTQAALHLFLLAVFTIVLPISAQFDFWPELKDYPQIWLLVLMVLTVGGPFFVLAGSAPLLKHWFSHSDHPDSADPYFLYAASNLGSLTGLLAYPFLIEPVIGLQTQSVVWLWLYVLLIALTGMTAFLSRKDSHREPGYAISRSLFADVTMSRCFLWLALAFVPSSLLLGVTTFITTDIAPIPLLWVVPLALYISTYIIVFSKRPIISLAQARWIQTGLIIFFMLFLLSDQAVPWLTDQSELAFIYEYSFWLLGIHVVVFFFTALMCHHELAALRPHPVHLTKYFMFLALGGAMGGLFNALIAPRLFVIPLEYTLALILACFLRFSSDRQTALPQVIQTIIHSSSEGIISLIRKSGLFLLFLTSVCAAASFFDIPFSVSLTTLVLLAGLLVFVSRRRWLFGFCAMAVLLTNIAQFDWRMHSDGEIIWQDRNFYGFHKITDKKLENIDWVMRSLVVGTTAQGMQIINKDPREYGRQGVFADMYGPVNTLNREHKVAVIGLGLGYPVCFETPDQHIDFFEIDPMVIEIAQSPEFFTHLSDCNTPYSIIRGDGRLSLEKMPDAYYDFIKIDAFSSDHIPVHLLTKEAFDLYKAKLKKDGYIGVNLSARYIDLKPVIAANAKHLNMTAYFKDVGLGVYYYPYAMLVSSQEHRQYYQERGWKELEDYRGFRGWTDDYSTLIHVMKNPYLQSWD